MRKVCDSLTAVLVMAFLFAPLSCLLTGCAATTDNRAALNAPLPELESAGLSLVWQRRLNIEKGERLTKAWRVGTSVYVATSESRIARFDAKSGVLVWTQALGRENFEIYKPIELGAAEGPPREVLVVTRGEVFRMNIQTGDWSTNARPGLSVSADPVLAGSTLCVGGAGTFRGLYLDRPNERRWSINSPGDLFASTPVVIDNNVIVASRKGQLWRVDGGNGDWDWKDRKVDGEVMGGLAADSRAVYVPCMNQRIYAFAVATGGYLWDTRLDGMLDQTPVPAGPVVLVLSRGRGLYAVERQHGDMKWNAAGVSQIGTTGDTSAWVEDNQGNLINISLEKGEVLSSTPATSVQFVVRNDLDRNVILVTYSGMVGMFKPK